MHINDISRHTNPFPSLQVVEPNSKLPPAHIFAIVSSFPFYFSCFPFPLQALSPGTSRGSSILLAVIGVRKHFLYGR